MGGHSVVAKRATSPKAPKQKSGNASRGNSPLAGRSGSPINSRATSPVNGVSGSRAGSPAQSSTSPSGSQKKRKATDDPSTTNGAPQKVKKRKTPANPAAAAPGVLEDRMVIEWLRNTPNASTRDCIAYFTPYLTDEAKKAKFTALVKEVAQLKDKILVLRKDYRGVSSAPGSPAA